MKLLKAANVGLLFNNPQLRTPAVGRLLRHVIAMALLTLLLLGPASAFAGGTARLNPTV